MTHLPPDICLRFMKIIAKPNPSGGYSPYWKWWIFTRPIIVTTQPWRRSKSFGTAWFDAGETNQFHPRFKDKNRCIEIVTEYFIKRKHDPKTILFAEMLWPNTKENQEKSDFISYREIHWDNPTIWKILP